MKLCFTGPGYNTHTQRWLQAFVHRGHDVHLVTVPADGVPGDAVPDLQGVALHPLPPGRPKLRFAAWVLGMRRILDSVRPDVLHAHYLTRYGWIAAASLFRPLVLTAWGTDVYIDPVRSAVARRVTGWALARAELVTVDADDLRERTIALGAPPERTAVVQWGVDTAVFHPGVDAAGLRSRLELGDGPVILSTRAITPLYNQHLLVAALPAVLERIPAARLIFKYGAHEEAYLAEVRAQVARLGLDGAVRFVPKTPYNELAGYYALGDVFVSIASSDSTPVSLLEAMACGAAPVVGDLPSLREWVRDGENGFVVPAGDPPALANRINRILESPALQDHFARTNVRLIQERASHEHEMARVEAMYEQLAGRN